jgi:hypothetical protein
VFGQRLTRITETFCNNLEDRAAESRRDILLKGRNSDALLTPDSTTVGKKLSAEKLQRSPFSI